MANTGVGGTECVEPDARRASVRHRRVHDQLLSSFADRSIGRENGWMFRNNNEDRHHYCNSTNERTHKQTNKKTRETFKYFEFVDDDAERRPLARVGVPAALQQTEQQRRRVR